MARPLVYLPAALLALLLPVVAFAAMMFGWGAVLLVLWGAATFTGVGFLVWVALVQRVVVPVQEGMREAADDDRRRRGLCTACGYDLRATPDKCPECGAPAGPPAPAGKEGPV